MMRKLKITNFITRKIDYIFVSKDLKVPYSALTSFLLTIDPMWRQ